MTTQNLNPVRIMRIDDWYKVAQSLDIPIIGLTPEQLLCINTCDLIERYESEVFKPLERKHFVCEVEKPIEPITDRDVFVEQTGGIQNEMITDAMFTEHHLKKIKWYEREAAYESAQSDLIFEGFEVHDMTVKCGEVQIAFSYHLNSCWLRLNQLSRLFSDIEIHNPTISDIIYYVHKYNETATNKIELKFTEAFIKKIAG